MLGFGQMMMSGASFDPNGANNPGTTPATPAMTSNTAPSGKVTVSFAHDGAASAYMAFDQRADDQGNRWMLRPDGSIPGWIDYEFPAALCINKLGVCPLYAWPQRAPGSFAVHGSPDGFDYYLLASFSGLTGWDGAGQVRWFTWSNSYAYKTYRFMITGGTTGGDGYVGIGDLQYVSVGAGAPLRPLRISPATPVMTSDTTPSGIASASGTHNAGEFSYMAYDQRVDSRWMLNTLPGWSQYQFPTPQVINRVGLYPTSDFLGRSPGAFTVTASNDGSSWTTLLTVTGLVQADWSWAFKYFSFPNTTAYTRYRLTITAGVPTTDGYTGCNEIHWIAAA